MKPRHPWAIIPGMAAVLILAAAGIGQGQLGIGGPGEGVKLALLRLPAVQKELKLTDPQKREVAKLGEQTKVAKKEIETASKTQEKSRGGPIPKGMPDPLKEAREAQFAELVTVADESLKKLLDAKQRARLSEIALQMEGPRAFVGLELFRALNLSDEQVEEFRNILGGLQEQVDQAKAIQKEAGDLGNLALEKVSKEQQKVQLRTMALKGGKKAMAEIGKLLSKRQRDKYVKMLGEPFALAGLTDEDGQKLFDDSPSLSSRLIQMPAIRAELKVTTEQAEALDRGDAVAKALKPEQRARLDQIELQAEGASAFARASLHRSLRLDGDQVEQIQGFLDGLGDARRQLRESRKQADELRKAQGDPESDPAVEKTRKEQAKEQMRADADQMGQGVMARIMEVLSKAQRASYRKQLGEPFDLAKLRGEDGKPRPKGAFR